ncbi:MAG: DUF1236 domain-containing protein, partial [Bradyrhizobium sp.]
PSTGRSGAEQGGAMHHRLSPQHSAQSQQKNSTVGKASPGEAKPSDQKKGMNSENEAAGQKEMKSQGRKGRAAAQGTESPKQAEQRKSQTTGQHQGQAASTSGRSETQKSPTAARSGAQQRSQTTGQAGAAGKLSTQQRSQITSAIKDEHVATTKNVNFSIAVGTRVPREHVSLHPLPSRVVKIYPEWRGYKFILVRDEIVVVNPRTYEIVAVLPG